MYVVSNKNLKCRIYEDDYETSVYDLNNNLRRRELMTKNVIGIMSECDA